MLSLLSRSGPGEENPCKVTQKEMNTEEFEANKKEQAYLMRRYNQYLKLERSLSPNTCEAYQADVAKLLSFLSVEGVRVKDVTLDVLHGFAAGLHGCRSVNGQVYSRYIKRKGYSQNEYPFQN